MRGTSYLLKSAKDVGIVCTWPVEYCEFNTSLTRCKEWLESTHPDEFARYYSIDALKDKVGTLSIEAQEKLEKDTAKKERKAEKKKEDEEKKRAGSAITIKRVERNKRKHITAIHGLEAFDVDLKATAKFLAGRFATGASVTKNAQSQDEVVVQGDCADEVYEMIEKGEKIFGKNIPIKNVSIVEEKKKKSAD